MSINPVHYEDLVSYPGEDILSASVLRAKENIPSNEVVELLEGSMWYRWFNQDQLQQGTSPIIISIGGTGAAMFYNTFAEKLAGFYQGPVLIYDRFNMGLSDNIQSSRNGMKLWHSQLDQMLDSEIIGLKDKQIHWCTFSLATAIVLPYAVQNPTRVKSIAFLSGMIGGGSPNLLKTYSKLKKAVSLGNCCCLCGGNKMIFGKLVIPRLYKRCEHQVEEGGDPAGLTIAKAMYRVKGFTVKFKEQQMDPTILNAIYNGTDAMCTQLALQKIPVYIRNYEQDHDINRDGWIRLWNILKGPGNENVMCSGEHHKFYEDNTAEKLASFAALNN